MQTQAAQANVQYRQPTVEEVMARTQQTAPSPISSTAPYQPPSVDEVLARGQAEAGASQQYVVHEQGQTKKPPLLFRLLGHTSDANSRWNTAFRFVKLVAKSFGIFALIIIVGRFFIFSPGAVNGPSMERTFLDEDTFYVNRFVYLISAPKRYDVVQMINPQEEKLIIKRVIGLPGETVVIRRGKVFVIPVGQKEQVEVPEPYLREGITTTVPLQQGAAAFTLEADEYFVIGDNRPKSIDSRNYGPVGREEIIGRVVLKPEQKIQVTFPASVDET
jgi:signal peptidase I